MKSSCEYTDEQVRTVERGWWSNLLYVQEELRDGYLPTKIVEKISEEVDEMGVPCIS